MDTRHPAVSGLFYSAEPDQLAYEVDQMLLKSERPPEKGVRALVVPHAGYVYSGDVAAIAFNCLPVEGQYKYILLLGPSHHVAFQGMAVPRCEYFQTPLGDMPLAQGVIQKWVYEGKVHYHDLAHKQEHCLEVMLPFLQRGQISGPLVPVVVGNAPPEQIAKIISPALNDPNVLTIISTDMSHYHGYDEAMGIDRYTHERILAGACDIHGDEACGYRGLNGLQKALTTTGYRMHLLHKCNSGDRGGDKHCVVGYAAYAVY